MAATWTITKAAPYHWRYEWAGTSPYYVVQKGRLVFQPYTTRTSWIFQHDDDEQPPVVQIYDSTESEDALQQIVNPPFATLQWWHAPYASYYVVQKQNTQGTWVDQKPTIFDAGLGYYTFVTAVLDDEETTSFRVKSIDAQGAISYVQYDVYMVRNPDVPRVSYSYSPSSGDLTISERA